MCISRWKGQSLQFHRNVAGPGSHAVREHGILPAYARAAFEIAAAAGAIAGMAKKCWRDGDLGRIPIDAVRALRAKINASFDRLEAMLDEEGPAIEPATASRKGAQADRNFQRHGNLAILALGLMEESAELAAPLMQIAEGSKTLQDVKQEIDDETADVRINLHLTSESASVCSETSTGAKWARVRDRFNPELFEVTPLASANDTTEPAPKKAKSK